MPRRSLLAHRLVFLLRRIPVTDIITTPLTTPTPRPVPTVHPRLVSQLRRHCPGRCIRAWLRWATAAPPAMEPARHPRAPRPKIASTRSSHFRAAPFASVPVGATMRSSGCTRAASQAAPRATAHSITSMHMSPCSVTVTSAPQMVSPRSPLLSSPRINRLLTVTPHLRIQGDAQAVAQAEEGRAGPCVCYCPLPQLALEWDRPGSCLRNQRGSHPAPLRFRLCFVPGRARNHAHLDPSQLGPRPHRLAEQLRLLSLGVLPSRLRGWGSWPQCSSRQHQQPAPEPSHHSPSHEPA